MSFTSDDPLAGILSDGSDDSFFDDDVLGKKKPVKKKGGTDVADKMSSLFNFEETDKSKPELKETVFNLGGEKNPTSSVAKNTVLKESFALKGGEIKSKAISPLDINKSPANTKVSVSIDKLDIINEFDDGKKGSTKLLEKKKSSQSLLDDILGVAPPKPSGLNHVSRPVTAAKSKDFDFDSFLSKPESKEKLNTAKNTLQKQNAKIDNRPEEVTKPKKKSSDDWLNVFQDKEDDNIDDVNMPSWLAGADTKKKNIDKKPDKDEIIQENTEEEVISKETEKDVRKEPIHHLNQVPEIIKISSINELKPNDEDVSAESAALYLQQQESQLMLALQLKAQEEKLVAMQMRQKENQRVQREVMLARNAQLDTILKKQSDNRLQMQAIIADHQERITKRIKDLLSSNPVEYDDSDNFPNEYEESKAGHKETPHTKERKQLLQLIQSLQDNHDKEIDLMESSYRRQLAFLEVSLNQSEERMKEESNKLVKFYTEKINWLEDHHNVYRKMTDDNLSALSERHRMESEILRQQHLENVKVLQENHAALMENVKNAVKQEQTLIKDSTAFSSDLQELIVDIKENKSQCQIIVERVQTINESTQKESERNLNIRESQINDMIQQLKRERENFETEKTESRELVKMLETRLKQMTTIIEEETASLKQKKMEFEFEKATFSKQTEFAKNLLKKQDEEIKMLREEIQKEYNDKTAKIDEEKKQAMKETALIAKEKASAQSLKEELEMMKSELKVKLEEMAEDRSKLNVEKQQLKMEEQRILAKSRDLDLLAKTSMDKQSQADKKYSEAEFLQRKYEERIRRIQEHIVSLNTREKEIAKEKVVLSRERLQLHNERKQIETKQCSLCKSTQNNAHYNADPYIAPESLHSVSRDYKNTSVNNAMNAIEQEMAHLIGSNFRLRHSVGIGNLKSHEDRFIDINGRLDVTDKGSMNLESGTFKDYMDPKFMMLRLDVQKVLSNLDQSRKNDLHTDEEEEHFVSNN